ncbi:MAG TPA: hypothetical protein VF086_03225 [Propionibacteriaceae bacterium]
MREAARQGLVVTRTVHTITEADAADEADAAGLKAEAVDVSIVVMCAPPSC